MIIIVEGNIGAGKTTIIKHLETFYTNLGHTVEVFEEGVEDTPLKLLLELFYTDMPRYAFSIQTAFFTRLYFQQQRAVELSEEGVICIMDRSLFGNNVFSKLHLKLHNLSFDEYFVLKRMIEEFPYIEQCDVMLYIQTSSIVCQKRDSERKRDETKVDLSYFIQLGIEYEKQLETCPIPVEILRWNVEFLDGLEILNLLATSFLEKYGTEKECESFVEYGEEPKDDNVYNQLTQFVRCAKCKKIYQAFFPTEHTCNF